MEMDTLEGLIDDRWSFHDDAESDVLYLTLVAERQTEAWGDEDDEGVVLRRALDGDRPVGLTIVSWWQRFGDGPLPDSMPDLARWIRPWADRLAG